MVSALMKKKVRDGEGSEKIDSGKRQVDFADNENNKKRSKSVESKASAAMESAGAKIGNASDEAKTLESNAEALFMKPQGKAILTPKEEGKDLEDNSDGSGRLTGDVATLETGYMSFPEKIMMLLNKNVASDAMWWLSDGDSFCILPIPFTEKVLDTHFQGTKFESFTRKLNRWGFKRVAGEGIPSNAIAFYHNLFHKDKPELLKEMSGGKTRSPGDNLEKTVVGKIENNIPDVSASQWVSERGFHDNDRGFGETSQRQKILEASATQDILNRVTREALIAGSDSGDGRHQVNPSPQLRALLAQQMGINTLTSEVFLRNQLLSGRNLNQLPSESLPLASHLRSSEIENLLSQADTARILAQQRESLYQSSLSADSTRLLLQQLGAYNQLGSTDAAARLLAQRGAGSLNGNASEGASLLSQLSSSQLGSDSDATLRLLLAQRAQADLMNNNVASALMRQQIGAGDLNSSASSLQSRLLAERLQSIEGRDSSELLNRLLLQQMVAPPPLDSLDLRTRLLMQAAGSGRGLGDQSLTDQQLNELYMLEQQRDLRARLGIGGFGH